MTDGSGSELLGLLQSILVSALHDGLDLRAVASVGDEVGDLLLEGSIGEVVGTVEVVPELVLESLSSGHGKLSLVHANGGHDSIGRVELLRLSEIRSQTLLGKHVRGHGQVALGAEELLSGLSIGGGHGANLDGGLNLCLERVLTVQLPDALVVGLVRDLGAHLVRIQEILLLDDLRGELMQLLPLGLELLTTLSSGSINAEDNVGGLVGVVERVELAVQVFRMGTLSEPVDLGLLVEEQAGAETLTELLHAEPLEHVSLLALTRELHGRRLGMEVGEGVVPGLSGVSIDLPAVSLLGGSPVGDSEALEDGTGLSVEGNISHTLKQS